jgi:hypothetical protein
VLTITAEPHNPTQYGYPGSWASGLLTSQGNFSQEYGYFEIRANFSDLPGAWDAFWLEPDQQTPDPNHAGRWQELDAVEHYGDNPTGVYSTIHTTDVAPSGTWQDNFQVYSQTSQAGGYHTYGVDWEPDTITFYVDGQAVGSKPTPSDMHSPMYFMANLATQNSQNPADAPITSSIDYIRAYASPNTIPGVNNLADQGGASTAGAPTDPAVTPPTVAAGSDQVAGTVVPPATDTATPTTVPVTGDPSAGTVMPPATTTGTDTPSTVTAGADQVPGIVPPATPAGTDAGATGHAAADGETPTTVVAAGDAGPSADTPAVTDASLPTTVHHHAFGLSEDLAQAHAACNDAMPLVEAGSWCTPAHNNQVPISGCSQPTSRLCSMRSAGHSPIRTTMLRPIQPSSSM